MAGIKHHQYLGWTFQLLKSFSLLVKIIGLKNILFYWRWTKSLLFYTHDSASHWNFVGSLLRKGKKESFYVSEGNYILSQGRNPKFPFQRSKSKDLGIDCWWIGYGCGIFKLLSNYLYFFLISIFLKNQNNRNIYFKNFQ